MITTPEVQSRLKQYLLGQLAEDSWEEVEKALLSDDDLFEELLIVEDELMDEYLSGKLSRNERSAFEQHFLNTAERYDQLKFARAFNRYLTTTRPPEPGAGRFWPALKTQPLVFGTTAIAMLLIAAIAALILIRDQRSPQTFATLTLTMSQGTRGDGPPIPVLKLPLREDALQIVLNLPEKPPPALRYQAELETAAGDKRRLEPSSQDPHSLTVVIPKTDLKQGQYAIKLFAIGNDGVEQRLQGAYLFTLE
jgi:methionine-rich copper-binding protein CopC